MTKKKMVKRMTWKQFRSTGLVLVINQILHIFGWAIVFDVDDKTGKITDVYPARVKYRGFNYELVENSHKQVAEYLKENIDALHEEANS